MEQVAGAKNFKHAPARIQAKLQTHYTVCTLQGLVSTVAYVGNPWGPQDPGTQPHSKRYDKQDIANKTLQTVCTAASPALQPAPPACSHNHNCCKNHAASATAALAVWVLWQYNTFQQQVWARQGQFSETAAEGADQECKG